jgi:hypothetical protein
MPVPIASCRSLSGYTWGVSIGKPLTRLSKMDTDVVWRARGAL